MGLQGAVVCDSRDAHIGDNTSDNQAGLHAQHEIRNYEPEIWKDTDF